MKSLSASWSWLTKGAYCDYDNTPSNSDTYGRLYNWYAATDARNICPTGWHVPSDVEWRTLINYLGGESVAGGKLRETGTTHWDSPNTGGTNETGFTALPGGYRNHTGSSFRLIGGHGHWWGNFSEYDYAPDYCICEINSSVEKNLSHKNHGFSVRCLRD